MLCSPHDHNNHIVVDLRKVKDEMLESITQEKSVVDKKIKNIRYEIEKKETIVTNFKKELNTIIKQILYGKTGTTTGKQIYNVGYSVERSLDDIECNPPEVIAAFLKQLKQLKAAKYIYEEIQDIQRRGMVIFRDEDCVTFFLQYKSLIEKYMSFPAIDSCEEAPDVNVVYDYPSDEEMKDLLCGIHTGKRDDIQTDQKRNSTILDVTQIQKQEKEHLITELHLKTLETE
ncbi:unnamed protein product [Mytilus coruscus]|uniref:Uncharacterized protein n=1 Tax=Mytilus coruscus TaxID=42192 RepID=A0A6J8C5V1_MYTCO|nr:unnamed protein product [Mytilus coruscus]